MSERPQYSSVGSSYRVTIINIQFRYFAVCIIFARRKLENSGEGRKGGGKRLFPTGNPTSQCTRSLNSNAAPYRLTFSENGYASEMSGYYSPAVNFGLYICYAIEVIALRGAARRVVRRRRTGWNFPRN